MTVPLRPPDDDGDEARQAFLVEAYAATRQVASDGDAAIKRATAAHEDGRPATELLSSIFIPGDETAFYLVSARQEAHVRSLLERAGVRFDRIVLADAETVRRRSLSP
jgi:hypothetical protein